MSPAWPRVGGQNPASQSMATCCEAGLLSHFVHCTLPFSAMAKRLHTRTAERAHDRRLTRLVVSIDRLLRLALRLRPESQLQHEIPVPASGTMASRYRSIYLSSSSSNPMEIPGYLGTSVGHWDFLLGGPRFKKSITLDLLSMVWALGYQRYLDTWVARYLGT